MREVHKSAVWGFNADTEVVNSLLFIMMAYKFFKSNKFMPSGLSEYQVHSSRYFGVLLSISADAT
jgi:uncharacterized membrane protein (UPF0136 family)